MEYDPASPTDEPDPPAHNVLQNFELDMDLSTIPLPDPPKDVKFSAIDTSVCDIPLPPMDVDAANIPLPPSIEKPLIPSSPVLPAPKANENFAERVSNTPEVLPDVLAGPLKFSLKVTSKPLAGSEAPGEASGIFESTKDSKTEEPRPMPKLQALMKRSKPSQLPVGVLPSKIKLPASENKTELFLPTKETEVSSTPLGLGEATKVISSVSGISGLSTSQVNVQMEPFESSVSKDTSFSLQTTVHNSVVISDAPAVSQTFSSGNSVTSSNSLLAVSASVQLSTINSVTPMVSVPLTTIPNLMSLSVQPVQTLVTTPVTAIIPDPTIVLRQPKMNMANMQYVNPQKLRSAQMIATPLIANPALAAQSQTADQLSKDSRKRSSSRSRTRSRSRRRSRSRHRSGQRYRSHRHRSSSSSDESPRYSSRRFQRRSRSRESSDRIRSRDRKYDRDRDRSKREIERRRERPSRNDTKHMSHDSRDIQNRRGRSRTPRHDRRTARSRSSSSPVKERHKRDRDARRDRTAKDGKDKAYRAHDSSRQKDVKNKDSSPRKSDRHDSHRSSVGERSNSLKKSSQDNQRKENMKCRDRSHIDSRRKSDTQRKSVLPDTSSESDSSTSETSVSAKRPKRVFDTDEKIREASNDTERSNSSSSTNVNSQSPLHSKCDSRKGDEKHSNEAVTTKSLSTRESELLSASLQSKNAGIGSNPEVDSAPVTPDDHGSEVVLSVPSESETMDISSGSETPDADIVGSSVDNRGMNTGLQVLCTTLVEAVPEDQLTGIARDDRGVTDVVKTGNVVLDLHPSDTILSGPLNEDIPRVVRCSDEVRDEPKYALRKRKSKRSKDLNMHTKCYLTPLQLDWFR